MTLTNAEKAAEHSDVWTPLLRDALLPLLADDTTKPGLVAIRTFYMVRHADGTLSAGNVGGAPIKEVEHGERLMRLIAGLLVDYENNRTAHLYEGPAKN